MNSLPTDYTSAKARTEHPPVPWTLNGGKKKSARRLSAPSSTWSRFRNSSMGKTSFSSGRRCESAEGTSVDGPWAGTSSYQPPTLAPSDPTAFGSSETTYSAASPVT